MRNTSVSPYADAWGFFSRNTKNHQLEVLHDDGLYRHLKMSAPGTGIWSWSVVTWPGYLSITGDIGKGFTFSREPDMFHFFSLWPKDDFYQGGFPRINPEYWEEKLSEACADKAQSYDSSKFLNWIQKELNESETDPEDVSRILGEALLSSSSEEEAVQWLESSIDFCDTWDSSILRRYSTGYLIACYAITVTIHTYQTMKKDQVGSIPEYPIPIENHLEDRRFFSDV